MFCFKKRSPDVWLFARAHSWYSVMTWNIGVHTSSPILSVLSILMMCCLILFLIMMICSGSLLASLPWCLYTFCLSLNTSCGVADSVVVSGLSSEFFLQWLHHVVRIR